MNTNFVKYTSTHSDTSTPINTLALKNMHPRAAKDIAMKALCDNLGDAENLNIVNNVNTENTETNVPTYTQNAPTGLTLDLVKQYSRRIEFCDREMIRIHDKSINKKDQGSEDRGLIYVDFKAGIFEALKVNFVACLKNYNTNLIAEPKIEMYGEALERVCLDLRMKVGEHTHDVKIKVHNTKCSLDVAGFHDVVAKRFDHLDNLTVGEYFAKNVITKIVEQINANIDITELNNKLRAMANEGKKASKSSKTKGVKNTCKKCEKDVKSAKTLKCFMCKEITHYNCLTVALTTEEKDFMNKKDHYKCGQCEVYPQRAITAIENDDEEIVDAIKLRVVLPSISQALQHNPPQQIVDLTSAQYEEDHVENHLDLEPELTCDECGMKFENGELLEMHINVSHEKRGTKRNRQDTSLIFDSRQCTNCEQNKLEYEKLNEIKAENEKLRSEQEKQNQKLLLVHAAYEETKLNLIYVTKELNDKKEAFQKLTDELAKVSQEMRDIPNSSNDLQESIKRKNEQLEIVKELVVDRDKTIKKMEEAHKKETSLLQKEKKASEDTLSCATEENTKLKDKEKTLLDIFKYMKQHLDEQLSKSPSPVGSNNYSCSDCDNSFISIDDLNHHKRTEHLIAVKTCQTCMFQAKSNCEYENHVKSHNNIKLYVCGICKFSAPNEENLSSHQRVKHSQQKCDHCNFLAIKDTDLNKHIQETHGACSKKKFECDECIFTDYSEENVLNHKIEKHSICICELCEFETTSEQSLNEHVQDIHRQTKFPCNICSESFKTHRLLREHIKTHHTTPIFPCDYCGQKLGSLQNLDIHIGTFHRISKIKPRDILSRDPCDFKNPQHKSSCCDRDQGKKKMKIYTPKERIENGACRNWNESTCRFADLCRFAHIEICKFQESCRNPSNCLFFHFNKSNINFLCGTSYRAFIFNQKDFPPLPRRN